MKAFRSSFRPPVGQKKRKKRTRQLAVSLARQRVVWFWNAVSVGLDDVKEKDSWLPPPTPLTADRCSMMTFFVHGAIQWAVSRAINLLRF